MRVILWKYEKDVEDVNSQSELKRGMPPLHDSIETHDNL